MKKNEDILFHVGHRERLRQKFLAGKLADYELVELFLTYLIPRRDVRTLARSLMARFGGVHQIVYAPIEELMEFSGIGESVAIGLKTIREIMKLSFQHQMENEFFNDEKYLCEYCRALVFGKPVEECHVLYLGVGKRLIKHEVHSRGTIDWTSIYAREVMKCAMGVNAKYVIVIHNHPSGIADFSTADHEMTKELKTQLDVAGVVLLDHLVVANGTGVIYSGTTGRILK